MSGGGTHTNYEPLEYHDFIELPSLLKQGIIKECCDLFKQGLSLVQIAKKLNRSKSFIQKTLKKANLMPKILNLGHHRSKIRDITPQGGVPPFGYQYYRGKLIVDAKEIQIVHIILKLWQSGQSYYAIAKYLNNHGYKTRKDKKWGHSLVRSIVQRHQNKNIEEGLCGLKMQYN